MKLVKCSEGHGYDSEKFDSCPMCARAASGKKVKVLKVKAAKRPEPPKAEAKPEPEKKAEKPKA